jgi:hypothetical protein
MTGALTTLPVKPGNYIQVRRYGRQWCISLVSPVEGSRPITTKLGSHPRKEAAIEYAQHVRARTGLPLRLPSERAP